jgi:hypothetical protein
MMEESRSLLSDQEVIAEKHPSERVISGSLLALGSHLRNPPVLT